MELILIYLISATIYNLPFIIFGIIAWCKASKPKPYQGFLVAGVLLNMVSYFGYFAGLKRNPALYGERLGSMIWNMVYLAIALGLILYACTKSYKEATAKAEAEKQNQIPESKV